MGKATIINGGTDSLYLIELKQDRSRVDARITAIDEELNNINIVEYADLSVKYSIAKSALISSKGFLDSGINGLSAGTTTRAEILLLQKDVLEKQREHDVALEKFNSVKLKKLELEKEKQYLQNSTPADAQVLAWCVDYNESLTGDVGTIEIPGQRNGVPVLIKPSFSDGAVYNNSDGILQYSVASTPEGFFYNLAMLPGWQKWKPTFRLGTLSSINYDTDTCVVTLDAAISSQQSLDTNQFPVFYGVKIQYMGCNSGAFINGDRVVVEFTGQDILKPVVIGFETYPQLCPAGQLLGDAKSDTELATNKYFFERNPSWKITATTSIGGNVDWKGKSADDTLSFDGPQSRYWWPENNWGYSTSIYKAGSLLCTVPNWVMGCALYTYNSVKYLNVVGFDSALQKLTVHQRVYSDTYANDGAYNASTNPLGWKEIYSETLTLFERPSTIFCFNASGNEVQGIFGEREIGTPVIENYSPFQTRVKLSIVGETVTRTNYDAKYDFTLTVTDSFINADNSSQTITCLNYIMCAVQTCAHQQTVSVTDRHYQQDTTSNDVINNKSCICVDYIGDQEEFAEVTRINANRTQNIDKTLTGNGTTNDYQDCGGASGQDSVSDHLYNSTDNSTFQETEFVLTFRGRSIELEYNKTILSDVFNESGHIEYLDWVNTVDDKSQSRNRLQTAKYYWRDIQYLDLRSDTILFTEMDGTDTSTENTSWKTGDAPIQGTAFDNTVRIFSAVAMLSGVRHVLNTVTQTWNTSTQAYTAYFDGNGIVSIPSTPADGTVQVNTFNVKDNGQRFWDYMNRESVKYSLPSQWNQSVGVDYAGNRFISATIWEEANGTKTYTNRGIWNHLSGGDPVTLTGLVGANPHFWPISVIK